MKIILVLIFLTAPLIANAVELTIVDECNKACITNECFEMCINERGVYSSTQGLSVEAHGRYNMPKQYELTACYENESENCLCNGHDEMIESKGKKCNEICPKENPCLFGTKTMISKRQELIEKCDDLIDDAENVPSNKEYASGYLTQLEQIKWLKAQAYCTRALIMERLTKHEM